MVDHDPHKDQAYFTRRAREERGRAATCEDNAAALAHLKMAEEYERRVARTVTPLELVPCQMAAS